MITLKSKKNILTLNTYWFSKKPVPMKTFSFTIYRQCQLNHKFTPFVKIPFNTIHIDLNNEISIIRSAFTKTTQYEIRRAERDGVECLTNLPIEQFVEFFNIFSRSKNRAEIKKSEIQSFGKNLLITGAFHDKTALVMHCYIIDSEGKRARLLHSASEFRNLTSSDQRNLVARANRLLHFYDICVSKNLGLKIYDLGGYSIVDIDEEKRKINDFKKSFGGMIVDEPDYISFLLYFTLYIINKLKTFRRRNQYSSVTPIP